MAGPKAATALGRDMGPVQATVRLIGRRWHLMALNELMRSPQGFHDLKRSLRGIRPNVLSATLSDLQEQGLVVREVCERSPIVVRYSLTDKGTELEALFHAMRAWGEKWATAEA